MERATIAVFNDHLADPDRIIERLLLEHDWVAEEGSYAMEPADETHNLIVPEDVTEVITLFYVTGAYIYVNSKGNTEGHRGCLQQACSSPRALQEDPIFEDEDDDMVAAPSRYCSAVLLALPGKHRTVSRRILTKLFTVAAGSESFVPTAYNSNGSLDSCKT